MEKVSFARMVEITQVTYVSLYVHGVLVLTQQCGTDKNSLLTFQTASV